MNPAKNQPVNTKTEPTQFTTAGELFEYLGTRVDPSTKIRIHNNGTLEPVWLGEWEVRKSAFRDLGEGLAEELQEGEKILALF